MGVSMFLVWRKGLHSPGVKSALAIFLFQLALNSLWSIVFFGSRSIVGGLAVIVLLWFAIAWTAKRFFGISKSAAALLIPYLAWVSFALFLNVSLAFINR
jgi:tryptophan-rich sensory protein